MTHLYCIFAQGHWVAMPIILSTASSSVKRFVTVLVKCVKNMTYLLFNLHPFEAMKGKKYL